MFMEIGNQDRPCEECGRPAIVNLCGKHLCTVCVAPYKDRLFEQAVHNMTAKAAKREEKQ